MSKYTDLLKSKMSESSFAKLEALKNENVLDFIGTFTEHCNPASLYVCDDSKEDEAHMRKVALENGEEHPMANSKQTIHWDGYGDQARDKVNTRYMVYPENMEKMKAMNSLPYDEALEEIMGIAKGIMEGKKLTSNSSQKDPLTAPLPSPVFSSQTLLT